MNRRLLAGLGASACVVGLGLFTPGSASAAADTASYQATLSPITANNVIGNGASWITVNGTTADVKIQVNGLLNGVPHAQHIHVDAQGQCPSAPQQHTGGPSITVTDGAPFYGTIGTSLTTSGDTSPAAALAVTDFPATGSYTYSRTIDLDPNVVANLAKGTAVLVVHGIDYNNNGSYDAVLGASELDPTLPAEATDPALCGTFTAMQMAGVPDGAANTGGGSTAIGSTAGFTTVTATTAGGSSASALTTSSVEIGIGAAALLAAVGATFVVTRRRSLAKQ